VSDLLQEFNQQKVGEARQQRTVTTSRNVDANQNEATVNTRKRGSEEGNSSKENLLVSCLRILIIILESILSSSLNLNLQLARFSIEKSFRFWEIPFFEVWFLGISTLKSLIQSAKSELATNSQSSPSISRSTNSSDHEQTPNKMEILGIDDIFRKARFINEINFSQKTWQNQSQHGREHQTRQFC